jgi:transcriptional regulator with XRE-family HTH domain
MLDLEQIRRLLIDRRIDMVADATGLHYATVQEVRSGKQSNPSYNTVKALSEYLEGKANG